MGRLLCQFSCGAASAIAAKLILLKYGETHVVHVVNAYIEEEHKDNRRFLADCEKWFGRKIVVLKDEKYGASAHEVFKRSNFIKNRFTALCSKKLKAEVLKAFSLPSDVMVLGYTAEEQNRYDRFLDANNIECIAPLIDAGLSKADCLAMLQNAGLELPEMYKMGYNNANCIGCVKGGMGYWNKIRVDFPEQFKAMSDIEERIGPGAYLFRNRKTGVRFGLKQLPEDAGRFSDELDISCSFFCEITEGGYLA